MKQGAILDTEPGRIAALHQLQILDTAPEQDFDDIAALASEICQAPFAAIAFEDNDRIWFKARHKFDITQIPRDSTFFHLGDTHNGYGPIIIENCKTDDRFTKNILVSGNLEIQFIACIPLINENRLIIGYLCVFDNKTRSITSKQISGLQILAKQVEMLLKLRLHIIRLEQAEEEAKVSEELMNAIFHNSIDAIIVMNENGVITQWNPKAERIFGWTETETIGKYFHKLIIPEGIHPQYLEWMKPYETIAKADSFNNTIEITAKRKDKSEFEIALGISSIIIKGERFYINFASDITDRVIATNKLDKQKEFYENILNKLPTDIAVFDANHKYLFVNPGAIKDEELRKFIVGKDDFEYAEFRNRDKQIAEKRRKEFLQIKKSRKEIRWEDTINDPDGTPITHLRRLFPVFDDQGEISMVIGFGIDITERKVMEEKQTALVKQLSSQNTQLFDFCNIVSHNLRAPLVNMSMLVNFIEDCKDENEKKMLIDSLNPVLENLHTTFNELVESIQIKQDLEVKSEKNILADCLKRTIDGLRMEVNKSEAKITADFKEAGVIYYPPKYLLSIFHNLVSNALKYQSPARQPLIELKTIKKENSIILSVKDNGLGIDMVKHKDNFFKIGKVFHRHPEAKGFGLFMTKTQVEAMDGNIWVESKPGEGSTFFIEFKKQ